MRALTTFARRLAVSLILSWCTNSVAIAARGDCSQPFSNGLGPTASDCLVILRVAVGSQTCSPACVCDPSGGSGVTASDALICLKKAVRQDIALHCPCVVVTTTTTASVPTTITVPTTSTTSPSGSSTLTVPTTSTTTTTTGAIVTTTLVTTTTLPTPCLDPIEPTAERVTEAIMLALSPGQPSSVAPTCGQEPSVCCPSGTPEDCAMLFDFVSDDVVVTATSDPRRFTYTIPVRVRTPAPLPFEISGLDCDLTVDSADSGAPTVELSGEMDFDVHPNSPDPDPTRARSISFDVTSLDDDDMSIGGGLGCALANFGVGAANGLVSDTIASALAVDACLACDTTALGACPSACTEVSKPVEIPPVDVIFVVDNSGSMTDEIAQVATNINPYFADVLSANGLDDRVITISGKGTISSQLCVAPPLAVADCNDNPPLYRAIDQSVGSKDSLSLILSTYANAMPALDWSTSLRFNAVKVFIEVTDDNSALSAASFDSQLLAKQPAGMFGTSSQRRYVFHSIVGVDSSNPSTKCTTAANNGAQYQAVSNMTGGGIFSSCTADYSALFSEIADRIVESTACSFPMPDGEGVGPVDSDYVAIRFTPSGGVPLDIPKVVDVSQCSDNAWYFDDNSVPTRLLLCADTCSTARADREATLEIVIGCAVSN